MFNPNISDKNFRSSIAGDDIGYIIYVFDTPYQKKLGVVQPLSRVSIFRKFSCWDCWDIWLCFSTKEKFSEYNLGCRTTLRLDLGFSFSLHHHFFHR